MNSSKGSEVFDRSGPLSFFNKQSELWWLFREALDPQHGADLALPPDSKSNWGIKGRLGRSPDRGDLIVMANIDTPKRSRGGRGRGHGGGDWRS